MTKEMIKEEQIKIDSADLRDDRDRSIARVVVENEVGTRAIAFLDARLVHGRVKFILTTKKNGGSRLSGERPTETVVHATADWKL